MPGEELVHSEVVYDGLVIRVRRDSILVHKAEGSVEATREVVDHPAR